jgi:multidrug efflux pump subunit AcrA (membrane-fusion protein)
MDGELKLGEFVNVWAMKESTHESLALPLEAVTEIEGRPVVFVKNAAEVYELRYVSTGERNGHEVVIKEGIKAGERIVSAGAYQVKLMYLNQ